MNILHAGNVFAAETVFQVDIVKKQSEWINEGFISKPSWILSDGQYQNALKDLKRQLFLYNSKKIHASMT